MRAQVAALVENSQIEPRYVRPSNPRYLAIYDRLVKRRVLEELKQFMAALRLPRKFVVQVDTCGGESRPYTPGGAATVCYELVDRIETLAAQRAGGDANLHDMVVTGAFIQALLVETSHAVFDVLKVPIWGRESDAADRLAALIMLQFGEDTATTAVLGTAQLFQWSNKTWTGRDFASANSPNAQRFKQLHLHGLWRRSHRVPRPDLRRIPPGGTSSPICEGEYEEFAGPSISGSCTLRSGPSDQDQVHAWLRPGDGK